MTDTSKALAVLDNSLTPEEFKKQQHILFKFVKAQLRESKDITKGGDYGLIPGVKKKSLFKPGAEKLLKLFGLSASYELLKEVEDFKNNFVYYKYRCTVTHAKTGTFISDAIRSSNNKEGWISKKYVYEAANNVEAKAQKRALVAATVQATMASEIFDAEINIDEDDEKTGSFKEDTNPERTALLRRLYGTASERGFGETALHTAAKREYSIKESLSELSNGQLKEFIERITLAFMPVDKGEAPKKFPKTSEEDPTTPVVESVEIIENAEEAEVIEEEEIKPTIYHCYNKAKHGENEEERPLVHHDPKDEYQNPCYCDKTCEDEDWGGEKKEPSSPKDRPWEKWKKDKDGKASSATEGSVQ